MSTRVTKKKATRKKTTKVKPKPNPVGRPCEYDPKYCDIVIEFMEKGYSKEAAAGELRISKNTFYRWAEKYEDFRDAVQLGETLSQKTWEGKAIDYSVHTKDGKRLDSRIYALQMKNRFGWSDKKEIDIGDKTKKTFGFVLDQAPEEIK